MRRWIAALAGAAVAWRERRRGDEEREARRAAEAAAKEERRRLQEQVAQRGEMVERLQRSRRAERAFAQELRSQLQRAYVDRGALAEEGDVRELVLRTAIELVGAEKGLLLARRDADSDGDLDLVAARGFDQDPAHSVLAQRFAHQVLERDRTVREDAPASESGGTPADAEIENLVAIPLYLMDRFQGVVVCANRPGGFEAVDDDLLLALGDHAGAALHTQRLQNELTDAHRGALRVLAHALEARDPVLRLEAGGSAVLVRALCRALELPEREHEVIASAALVRDVGHLGVPERVLLKPGPLTPEERAVVELHPRVGFSLVGQLPALSDVAEAVLYHHERFDGTGYPGGLAGDVIPLSARVLAVVDAYTAIVHERPHRPRRDRDVALEEITVGAGTQFDPEVAMAFVEEMRRSGLALDARLADAVSSALNSAGGVAPTLRDTPGPDPLTLLPGHRLFREAALVAGRVAGEADGAPFSVALVQVEGLEEINARDGYPAGDEVILSAARGAQRAALRLGGTAYRESGRRFAILITAAGAPGEPDLAAELHTELAIGPRVRLGVTEWRPGESGDDVVRRARAALHATVLPPG